MQRRETWIWGRESKKIVAYLERVAPVPTALQMHPEWSAKERALYERLRSLFQEKQTSLIRRREVKEKLLLKPAQLDAMDFTPVWNGRWRASVGHWYCRVRDALEAGVQEWKTVEAFDAAVRKSLPPTAAEIRAKLEKKKMSLKRKIDAAFTKAGKVPLQDVDAYSDLPHATLQVRSPIRDRRRVLAKKADKCEERFGDRRLAYDSAGDTSDSCRFDTYEENVVDAYLQGHKNLVYKNMTDIASYLADPSNNVQAIDDDSD